MASTIPTLLADAVEGGGLPPRPDASLAPYLDAAERCVRRYGWSRTSPKDIAREAGVERTTLYRHLGKKEQIFRLLIAREVHRIIDRASEVGLTAGGGPEVVIELVASTVEHVLANPVFAKLLDDEPELVGGFLERGLPDLIDRFTRALSPAVEAAMRAGLLAERDPVALTQWVVRVALSLVFAPAPGPLRPFLATLLAPALTVAPNPRRRKR